MKLNSKNYLLDSQFASYVKNYLVETYNQKNFELEVFNEKSEFLIEVALIGEDEYLTFMEPHMKNNLHKKNSKEFNTLHLMALESANEKMKDFIDLKFIGNEEYASVS